MLGRPKLNRATRLKLNRGSRPKLNRSTRPILGARSGLANIYQCDDGERNRNLAAQYNKIRNSINKDEMPLTYNLVSMLENGYKFDSRHDNEDYIFRTYFET